MGTFRVYCCTDIENGYRYIGFTGLRLEERLRSHMYVARYGVDTSPFKRALKEGRQFKVEILADNINELQEALRLEKYFIDKYRTYVGFADCKGYNGTLGGEHTNVTDTRAFISVYDTELNFLYAIDSVYKMSEQVGIDETSIENELDQGYIIIEDKIYIYASKGISYLLL